VPELIREAYANQLDDEEVTAMVQSIESVFRESVPDPRDDETVDADESAVTTADTDGSPVDTDDSDDLGFGFDL
jgi:hypothetical protein